MSELNARIGRVSWSITSLVAFSYIPGTCTRALRRNTCSFFFSLILRSFGTHARARCSSANNISFLIYTHIYAHGRVYPSCVYPRGRVYTDTCNHARKKIESRGNSPKGKENSRSPVIDNSPSVFFYLSIFFPRLSFLFAIYFLYMYSTYIFSSMLFIYLLSPFLATRMLCEWNLPLFFIFLSYKCKLVTIAYWTMFNNTINTR